MNNYYSSSDGRPVPPPVPVHRSGRPVSPPVPEHRSGRPVPEPIPDYKRNINRNIIDDLKRLGYGKNTFKCCKTIPSLVRHPDGTIDRTAQNKILENVWYDISGICYEYNSDNNTLNISFSSKCNDYVSAIDYIYTIPLSYNVNFVFKENSIKVINCLLRELSRRSIPQNVLIDGSFISFSMSNGEFIQSYPLPPNIRLSIYKKGDLYKSCCEEILMNLSDKDFEYFIQMLTPESKNHIQRLRLVAFDVYNEMPDYIKNSDNLKAKCDYIFEWVCKNVKYDYGACNRDGTLNTENGWIAQDPLYGVQTGNAVCLGRARLFKMLTNNCYTAIPCYIVEGLYGDKPKQLGNGKKTEQLPHGWNEIVTEDGGCLVYDASHLRFKNEPEDTHNDYVITKRILDNLINNGYTPCIPRKKLLNK